MASTHRTSIAILNDIFHEGGVERILSYMSLHLFAESEVVILLFDDSRIDFDYRGTILNFNVKPPPYSSMYEETYQLLRAFWHLVRAKQRLAVDVCISHKEGPNFINILSNLSKAVVVVHEHKSTGIKYTGVKRRIVRQLIRTLYNRASCVVTVSKGIADDLATNFGVHSRKLCVIYNPCDTKAIEDKAAEPIEDAYRHIFTGRVVVTAGRLVRQKGQWNLIRAFTELKRHIHDVSLLILGDGDHLGYLQGLAAELNVRDSVYFLGFQKNPFKFISRSDVFVLTSLWEGFGQVLVEAMACGIPIVSADCESGPRELLAPELEAKAPCDGVIYAAYGILTPPMDGRYRTATEPISAGEKHIAEALKSMLANSGLLERYADCGRRRVQEFNMETYVSQWNALIKRTIAAS